MVRPARHFVRRLLLLSGLYLSEEELTRRGSTGGGGTRKRVEAERILGLTPELMVEVGYSRREECKRGDRIPVSFFRTVKQKPARQ